MNNDIWLIGEIGWEVTLQSVIDQVENSDKTQPLNVHIHSQGGGVYDGLAIYNYLKGLPQDVHTHSSGLVASIASIIFLAGKKETRKINSTDSFLIHLPSGGSWGNAEDLEKTAEELRDIETKLVNVYVAETDLTADEALDLMKDDKFLDVDFLKEKGVVNEVIEFKAVAKFGNKDNMSDNLTKKEAESMFEKFGNKLKALLNPEEQAPDNKIVQDANGVNVDFKNVSADDEPKKGDEAVIDGKKAQGDVTMPNGEIWKFENGILNEIVEKKEESELEKVTATLEAQNELVATHETTIADLTAKLESKETKFTEIETAFTELKNEVTSSFEHDDKTDQPKKKENKESRTTFKSKVK